jgi:hypothetical protein
MIVCMKAQNIANIASLNASLLYDLNGVRFIHLDAIICLIMIPDFDKRNWRNNNSVTQYVNPEAKLNWLTNTLNSATTKERLPSRIT